MFKTLSAHQHQATDNGFQLTKQDMEYEEEIK